MSGLAAAVLVGSIAPILIRWSTAPSVAIVFYRLVFVTAIIAAITLVKYRDDLVQLTRRDTVGVAIAGTAMGFQLMGFFESLEWTSVAAAMALTQTQILFVALGASLLLGERLTVRTVVGMALAFLGAAVMITGGYISPELLVGEDPLYGNVLAVLAGAAFAVYLLAGRSLRQRIHLFPYVTIISAAATVVVLVFAVVEGIELAPATYPPREWLLFLGIALGPGVVTHTLINWSLKYLESSVVSVTMLSSPLVGTLYAVALLSEVPDAVTAVGGGIVLVGIYLTLVGTGDPDR